MSKYLRKKTQQLWTWTGGRELFLKTKSQIENSSFYHVRLFPLFLLEQHCEALPLLVVESLDVHQRLALEAQLQACETISVEKIRRDVTLDSSNKVFKGG